MALSEMERLIDEATALASGTCATGHQWRAEGGRPCPRGSSDCSQTVYRCVRCGEWDYGYEGGPAFSDCATICGYSCWDAQHSREDG